MTEEILLEGRVIEGEGGTRKKVHLEKEGSLKKKRGAATPKPVVIVLIIYNTGSGRSASFLNHSLQITLFLTS